jgi:hypothetical protein
MVYSSDRALGLPQRETLVSLSPLVIEPRQTLEW